MIMKVGRVFPFIEGDDYERIILGKYRYRLLNWVFVPVSGLVQSTVYIDVPDGRVWGVITPAGIWIAPRYSWDGCTKSPDYPGAMLACLVHDFFRQFINHPRVREINFTKAKIDWLFFLIMCASRFKLAFVYYSAVRTVGNLF